MADNKLPIGEIEDSKTQTVDDFKGVKKRVLHADEVVRIAGSALPEIKKKMDAGFTYETPDGFLLTTPEQVLQLVITKKSFVVKDPPPKEPEKKSTTFPKSVENRK